VLDSILDHVMRFFLITTEIETITRDRNRRKRGVGEFLVSHVMADDVELRVRSQTRRVRGTLGRRLSFWHLDK